jgi:hypothetical protein
MNHTKPLAHRFGTIKALIIYDDVECAKRAISILRRTSLLSSVPSQWEFKPWRADILSLPTAGKEALKEAVDADIIVLADLSGHGLRSGLMNWLQCWTARRTSTEPALVLTHAASSSEPSQEFFNFATQNDLDLIVEANQVGLEQLVDALVEPTVESPAYPSSDQLLVMQPGSSKNSYRYWGINE